MYKLLLCWRYLRTRYIALASIVSVTLGVATMIVVNSVMAGFSAEMQNRIHGILSDVMVEARSLDGMPNPDFVMEQIRTVAADSIEGMTPTVTVPALMNYQYGGQWITREVMLIGIDEKTQGVVSDFCKYLQHPENRENLSFDLREKDYDLYDHQATGTTPKRVQMGEAGWIHRRRTADSRGLYEPLRSNRKTRRASGPQPNNLGDAGMPPFGMEADDMAVPELGAAPVSAAPPQEHGQDGRGTRDMLYGEDGRGTRMPITPVSYDADGLAEDSRAMTPAITRSATDTTEPTPADDPFNSRNRAAREEAARFDPAKQQRTGIVLGIGLVSYRTAEGEDRFLALPGDDAKLTFPTVGMPPKAISDEFTIVDFYESKMSEFDGKFAFVPLRKLQELRGMIGTVNAIQIKLKPGVDGEKIRDRLRKAFPELYGVYTWRDKQGPLLAAVQMETAILNVLLFMIIAVAGFGILAIFYMIVVEKIRDIGILKSLGAPARGVMSIFLTYGLSLGLVGSGVGLVLGLLFVRYINQIADLLGRITGRPVFDPSIYYFYSIPTIVNPWTVAAIVFGAVAIAVVASILPALRAAQLHPVEALRHE
jgi:lipoprotein-releasing system permease protein